MLFIVMPKEHQTAKLSARKEASEEEFKRIAEAYDVLNDLEKRKIYDQFGKDGPGWGVERAGSSNGNGRSFITLADTVMLSKVVLELI